MLLLYFCLLTIVATAPQFEPYYNNFNGFGAGSFNFPFNEGLGSDVAPGEGLFPAFSSSFNLSPAQLAFPPLFSLAMPQLHFNGDESPYCPKWADNGECDTNPSYMLDSCKEACKKYRKSAKTRKAEIEVVAVDSQDISSPAESIELSEKDEMELLSQENIGASIPFYVNPGEAILLERSLAKSAERVSVETVLMETEENIVSIPDTEVSPEVAPIVADPEPVIEPDEPIEELVDIMEDVPEKSPEIPIEEGATPEEETGMAVVNDSEIADDDEAIPGKATEHTSLEDNAIDLNDSEIQQYNFEDMDGQSSNFRDAIAPEPETEMLETGTLETENFDTDILETEDNGSDISKTGNMETDTLETGNLETDMLETGNLETDMLETENLETDMLETENLETDMLETENLETDMLETGKLETDMLETENLETDMLETGKLETDMLETENLETDMLGTENLETDMLGTTSNEDQMGYENMEQNLGSINESSEIVIINSDDDVYHTPEYSSASSDEYVMNSGITSEGTSESVPEHVPMYDINEEKLGSIEIAIFPESSTSITEITDPIIETIQPLSEQILKKETDEPKETNTEQNIIKSSVELVEPEPYFPVESESKSELESEYVQEAEPEPTSEKEPTIGLVGEPEQEPEIQNAAPIQEEEHIKITNLRDLEKTVTKTKTKSKPKRKLKPSHAARNKKPDTRLEAPSIILKTKEQTPASKPSKIGPPGLPTFGDSINFHGTPFLSAFDPNIGKVHESAPDQIKETITQESAHQSKLISSESKPDFEEFAQKLALAIQKEIPQFSSLLPKNFEDAISKAANDPAFKYAKEPLPVYNDKLTNEQMEQFYPQASFYNQPSPQSSNTQQEPQFPQFPLYPSFPQAQAPEFSSFVWSGSEQAANPPANANFQAQPPASAPGAQTFDSRALYFAAGLPSANTPQLYANLDQTSPQQWQTQPGPRSPAIPQFPNFGDQYPRKS